MDIALYEYVIMPPTSKKLMGHIGFGLSMRGSVCLFVKNRACKVLKFHIWIPHGKIADTHFFLSELSPFLELCHFEKIRMKSGACHIL